MDDIMINKYLPGRFTNRPINRRKNETLTGFDLSLILYKGQLPA